LAKYRRGGDDAAIAHRRREFYSGKAEASHKWRLLPTRRQSCIACQWTARHPLSHKRWCAPRESLMGPCQADCRKDATYDGLMYSDVSFVGLAMAAERCYRLYGSISTKNRRDPRRERPAVAMKEMGGTINAVTGSDSRPSASRHRVGSGGYADGLLRAT
jgi:hypothetical protein